MAARPEPEPLPPSPGDAVEADEAPDETRGLTPLAASSPLHTPPIVPPRTSRPRSGAFQLSVQSGWKPAQAGFAK